jgi:nucleoid-associated protein YgaU
MADEQLLNQKKAKYQSVLDTIGRLGVRLRNVHIENGKLLIRGDAPSEDAKNQVWNQIKAVDASYSDLTADINVDTSMPQPQSAQAGASGSQTGGRTYTVQSGDTLSKIAKQFYGNANDYMKIFNANKDKLSDPDKIRPGQELVIP